MLIRSHDGAVADTYPLDENPWTVCQWLQRHQTGYRLDDNGDDHARDRLTVYPADSPPLTLHTGQWLIRHPNGTYDIAATDEELAARWTPVDEDAVLSNLDDHTPRFDSGPLVAEWTPEGERPT